MLVKDGKRTNHEKLASEPRLIEMLESRLRQTPVEEQAKKPAAPKETRKKNQRFNPFRSVFVISACIATLAAPFMWGVDAGTTQFFMGCIFCFSLILGSVIKFTERMIRKADSVSSPADPLWNGASGKTVMVFGVTVQLLLSAWAAIAGSFSGLPSAGLLMIVPFANLFAWKELRGQSAYAPHLRRFLCGFAVFMQVATFFFAMVNIKPFADFWQFLYFLLSLTLLSISAVLTLSLWRKPCGTNDDLKKTAFAAGLSSVLWMLPSIEQLVTCFEFVALKSEQVPISTWAFDRLQNETEDILASCCGNGDVRYALLPMDWRVDAYYKITGVSPWARLNLQSQYGNDNYYASQIIGSQSTAIKVIESSIIGTFDRNSLTAHYDWYLEFQGNASGLGKEARVLISLPQGTAVNGLKIVPPSGTMDLQGTQPVPNIIGDLRFGNNSKLRSDYANEAIRLRDPALATFVAPHTLMLQCAPIIGNNSIKTKLSITSPFHIIDGGKKSVLRIPQIIAGNMTPIPEARVQLKDARQRNSRQEGVRDVSGDFSFPLQQANKTFTVTGQQGKDVFIKRELIDSPTDTIIQKVVLAVDGSYSNRIVRANLRSLLSREAGKHIVKTIFSAPGTGLKEFDANASLQGLESCRFGGGDDNWLLLSRAIAAARDEKADVLWIHGPKEWKDGNTVTMNALPNNNTNVGPCPFELPKMCGDSVKIYDLQTVTGANEIVEHIYATRGDASVFLPLQNVHGIQSALDELFNTTSTGEQQKMLKFSFAREQNGMPNAIRSTDLITLAHNHSIDELIKAGHKKAAEEYASKERLLSMYTGALYMPENSERDTSNTAVGAATPTTSTPATAESNIVQGDPTIIQGVNTAGTVRVNNLANLEALLNILANGCEIFGLAYGSSMLVIGFGRLSTRSGQMRLVFGLGFIIAGLATPGVINWFVASARDANIFS